MKYRHKTNGSTMTYKDGCMRIENLVIEGHPNLDYWEKVVELSVPIGTRFKLYSKDLIIFTISKLLDNNCVLVEWDENKTNTTYTIEDVNSYFEDGIWIKYEEKEALFTTEDGKEIYEGDTFYWYAESINEVIQSVAKKGTTETDSNKYKKFSNIDSANSYYKYNQKLFSATDIENLVKTHCRDKVDSSLFAEVRKLVNERL